MKQLFLGFALWCVATFFTLFSAAYIKEIIETTDKWVTLICIFGGGGYLLMAGMVWRIIGRNQCEYWNRKKESHD